MSFPTKSNQQILTSVPADELQLAEFLNALVMLVTGVEIFEIPEENREEIVQDVLEFYTEFIHDFIAKRKGKRAGIQFKILNANKDISLLNRFEGLNMDIQDAHKDFVNTVSVI